MKLIKLTFDMGSFHEKGKHQGVRIINPQFIEAISQIGDGEGSWVRMAMGGDSYQVTETPDEIYKKIREAGKEINWSKIYDRGGEDKDEWAYNL